MPIEKVNEKLLIALKTSDVIATLHFSVYSAIITINSVLIGAFGIVVSVNPAIAKDTMLVCSILFFFPIFCVFTNYILLRSKNIKSSLDSLIETIDSDEQIKENQRNQYEQYKNYYYFDAPYWVLKTFEISGTFLTFTNIIMFITIIYFSKV